MQSGNGSKNSAAIQVLFGSGERMAIGRGLAELRAGRPLMIVGADDAPERPLLALPAEGLQAASLRALSEFVAPSQLRLVLSASRAGAIGQAVRGPLRFELPAAIDASAILALVGAPVVMSELKGTPASVLEKAGVRLMKLAQLLPALLAVIGEAA